MRPAPGENGGPDEKPPSPVSCEGVELCPQLNRTPS